MFQEVGVTLAQMVPPTLLPQAVQAVQVVQVALEVLVEQEALEETAEALFLLLLGPLQELAKLCP
jgi:hypothetical protein